MSYKEFKIEIVNKLADYYFLLCEKIETGQEGDYI